MGLPEAYKAVVLDQQRQLALLVKKAGLAPAKKLYEDMLADLEKKLRKLGDGDTLTHLQTRGLLAQAKLGLARTIHAMKGSFADASSEVGIAAARRMLEDTAKLEKHFSGGALIDLPVLETATLKGIMAEQAPSLLQVHETSMARYGVHVINRMESSLGLSIARGNTPNEAIDDIMDIGQMEWYRAERIVRTELSFSANRVGRAALDEQSAELGGDLWSRWTEHVSDDGRKLDDRVGEDSQAMHGQVAPPGGMFTQPPRAPGGEEVSPSLVGEKWHCPPNRPNDRAVLVPWRPHWGVPGWVWREGRRVPATPAVVEGMIPRSIKRARPVEEPGDELENRRRPSRGALVQVPPTFRRAAELEPEVAPAPIIEKVAESSAPLDQSIGEATLDQPTAIDMPTAPPKNQKRIAAAKKAAQASAERRREIFSTAKSNLPPELQVAWDKEGHKFMREQAKRIAGVKDPINAGSKISEAFAETYGSGAETAFGNEGDRFYKRAELEAKHAETWADDQESKYYEQMRREGMESGEIDENGELTELGRSKLDDAKGDLEPPPISTADEDPPF